ncbi:MAG: putative toxin-antitoxin system toxin component, PIN family [Prosthecobacter sp.]|uniref:putative toxin-antitoxin system toxin component, PIN family n=1 Tax=Prosthecobacter sp. TaxID=1965333 RepID=UPI0026312D42|nr:putative toxin-antitoxin system toxin component, PIN family [Prosthecobacter sp.]MCF7788928.1 putative toxin-antitoxin system toxin component, PIN family [Prosthecobacter sp.]
MFAVLDTNVLISGLRSSTGASHAVLNAVRSGQIKISLSVSLAIEYEDVALRPGMVPGLTPTQIGVVIDVLCALAHHQKVFFMWRPHLPDPGDDMVLELALAAGSPYIITNNIKDFADCETLGIQAIKPAEALNLIKP